MGKECIYINGTIVNEKENVIQAKDEGLLFGYGAFETIRVYEYTPFMLSEHLERLRSSLKKLEININIQEFIKDEIDRYIKYSNLRSGVLRITVTKGFKKANVVFSCRDIKYKQEDYEKGFSIRTSNIRRNSSSPIVYLKSLNYMDNIFAKIEVSRLGFDEALFINTDSIICECSSSNIFFIKDKIIYTPYIACGLLAGTVRELIIKNLSKKQKLYVREGSYTINFLYEADEVFITNSVLQIMPVTMVNDKIIGAGVPGHITKELMKQYEKEIRLNCYY